MAHIVTQKPSGELTSLYPSLAVVVASSDDGLRARIREWLADVADVALASDGPEALALCAARARGVAIVDEALKGMPGSLVAWSLKNDRRHGGCAVVLLGSPSRPLPDHVVDAVVPLPVAPDALQDALARALAQADRREPFVERRLAPRRRVAIPARLVAAAGEEAAEITSLGPAGAFARCSLPARPGERVAIAFEAADLTLEISAEVVAERGAGAERGVGLRFLELGAHAARGILLALESRGPAPPDPPMRRELELLISRLRRQQSAMVGLVAGQLSHHEDADAAIREVAEVTASIIGVARASIWLLGEDGLELRCRDLYVSTTREHSAGVVLHARDYPRYFAALAGGRAIDASDAPSDPRTSEFRDGYLVPLGITSMMDAAIHLDGRIVGVVCHEHVGGPRRWHPDEVGFAGAVADQVAMILGGEVRRSTRRALAEAEERTRLILEHAPDAVVTIDERGIVTSWNAMAVRLFGYPPAEALGRRLSELVVPERFRSAHDEGVRRFLANAEASVGRRVEMTARKRDGGEIPVELSLTPVRSPDGSIVSAFIRDLSVEQQIRRELTETNAQLEAIFHSFPDLYFWVRRDGTILRYHAGRTEDLFMAPAAFLGKLVTEVLPSPAAESVMAGVHKALSDRALASVEYALPFPDAPRYFEARFLPLDMDRAFCMVRDITSRIALLGRERQARETAEQALAVREEFLSIASHELRTPLTSLQLAVQQSLTLPGSAADPEARRYLQMAERQAKRLAVLVDRLLDVSRIQTGQVDLDLADTDLVAIVRRVLEAFRDEMAAAGCDLTLAEAGAVVGRWDGCRLEQVVTNVLGNALKYGARKPIHIDLAREAECAVMRVRDQGVGIAPEEQTRIFQPFARAAPLRSYGGLGLGLFIVSEIVRAHGGTIAVESAPGEGATFTVRLPCAGPPDGTYWGG